MTDSRYRTRPPAYNPAALQIFRYLERMGLIQSPPIEISVDMVLLDSHLNRAILVDSDEAVGLTLPAMSQRLDGAEITFTKAGVGNLTITAPGTDVIADSTAGGTIANTEATQTWATLRIKYFHAKTMWVVIGATGTWVTA